MTAQGLPGHFRRPVALVAVFLAVSTVLVACGGSGSESGQAPSEVKIGRARTLTYMVAYLAETLGYFNEAGKAAGTHITVVPFDSSSQSLPALVGRQTQFDIQLAQNGPRAQLENQKLLITTALSDSGVGGLVVGKGIEAPKDLVGKSVGFTGLATAAYPLLVAALKRDGVDATKVKFVTIRDQSAFQGALNSHQVDAVLPGEPVISQIVAAGQGKLMYDFFNRSLVENIMGGPYLSTVVMTTRAYRDRYPKVVQAVTDAMLRSLKWLRDHANQPDQVQAKLPDEFKGLGGASFAEVLKHVEEAISQNGLVRPDGLETVVAIDKAQGAIPTGKHIDLPALYDNSFVQSSPNFQGSKR